MSRSKKQNVHGGAGGAGGYSYQAMGAALVSARIIAETGLGWPETGCDRIPIKLLAETGGGGDDLRIHLKSDILVEVQAKSGIQKGHDFWEAMLDLADVVQRQPRTYGVLLTDTHASGPIRRELKNDLPRVGQGRDDDLKLITKEFLNKLKQEKIDKGVCRRLSIVVRDFGPTSAGESETVEILRSVLDVTSQCSSALPVLYKDGMELTHHRGARDRNLLVDKLYQASIPLRKSNTSPANVLDQINALFSANAANEQKAQQELWIKEAESQISRLREHWTSIDLPSAFDASQQFRQWLGQYDEKLPLAIKSEGYSLLFEVETSRLLQQDGTLSHSDTDLLHDLRDKAQAALLAMPMQQAEPTTKIEQKISSLSALLVAREAGHEAGLALLANQQNPFALRRYLSILVEAKQYDQALKIVRETPLEEEWVEKAAAIFATVEDYEAVLRTIDWATREGHDAKLPFRCAIFAANTLRSTALPDDPTNEFERITPESLDEEARGKLHAANHFLDRVTSAVLLRKQPPSSIEDIALQIQAINHAWLGEADRIVPLAALLERLTPLPTLLVYLAQHGMLSPKAEWAKRLRNEYPDQINLQIFAFAIEEIEPQNVERAFESLLQLVDSVPLQSLDISVRQLACSQLQEYAQSVGTSEIISKLHDAESRLLADEPRVQKRAEAIRLINKGDYDAATSLIEQSRDDQDPLWLDCHATILLNKGDIAEGFDALKRAVALNPHLGLLRQTASVAVQANDINEAIRLLERLLLRKPDDAEARFESASLCFQALEFDKAAEHLAILWKQLPERVAVGVNYAMALSQTGNTDASLQILENICTIEEPPLEALLRYAFLLKASGRTKEVFEVLNRQRQRLWEDPQFLMALSDAGFAVNQEAVAHEALAQVKHLQSTGKASDYIQEYSVDDFVAFFADRTEQAHETLQLVQFARVPWLTADHLLNHAWMEAWHNRTRQLDWIGEQSFAQAASAVYATDTLVINIGGGLDRIYQPLQKPEAGTAVVADISALLTLYHLNLLDKAATFFGQIFIPSTYLAYATEQAGRLVTGQQSRKEAFQAIKMAIDHRRITMVMPPGLDAPTLTQNDELALGEADKRVTMRDALDHLCSEGSIPVTFPCFGGQ